MQSLDDHTLLGQYVEAQSDEAFTGLVSRHINLVYSVALRQVHDPAQAEEITQAVFVILARKAAFLRHEKALSSWLFQTTRLTANNFIRSELRRQRREQEAYMQSLSDDSGEVVWLQVAPLLDDAVAALGEQDRRAIVLRYYEGRSLREVGLALGVSEAASEKRVGRALEKLRRFFFKHGVATSAAALAGTISTHSVQAAPAGLASAISAVACAQGAAASGSILTLVKGALKIMAWTKTNTAIGITVAAVLTAGTAGVIVKKTFFPTIRDSFFLENYLHFQRLPTGLFTLRRTHFTTPANGLDYSGESSSPAGEHVTRMMGRNRSFAQVLARLYNCSTSQVLLPPSAPQDHFDYLHTILDTKGLERFEAAIAKMGYAAHWEERDTEVLLLQVKAPNAPGLKPASSTKKQMTRWTSPSRLEFQNLSLASLAREIENLAHVPVKDETDLSAPYDYALDCTASELTSRHWDALNEALDPLGLTLVSTNLPMRMLVVEPVP